MTRHLAMIFLLLCAGTTACSDSDTHRPLDAGAEEDVLEDTGTEDAGRDADVTIEDEEDVPPPGPPKIDISPETITFSGVEIDDSQTTVVTILNLGEGPLIITDVQLNQFGQSTGSVFTPGDNWPSFPVEMEPNTFRDFDVVYTPSEPGAHRGEVVIFSTDPDEDRISLRIETISAYPEIELPQRLNFGTVQPGESQTERLEIYNRGLIPLVVESMEFDYTREGSQVFSTEIIAAANVDTLPVQLDRNHFFYLDVTFTPDDEETERADLLLHSTDPGNSPATVSISGNRPEPCLQTSGDIDFETIAPGSSSTKSLILLNCSQTRPLEITELQLIDDGGGVFEFVGSVDTEMTISPLQTEEIEIRATISEEQEVVGLISFSSDDPTAEEVEHQLRARPSSTEE